MLNKRMEINSSRALPFTTVLNNNHIEKIKTKERF